ncbi:hypothetical protein O3M35_006856 [Rhynocoris fuscipes]|uniref:Uncharacterized protein n=1 Tax=Rhynocoris fuscipes TaxID=488301 RepID=A0AAW1DK93_9HEMI
MVFSTSLTKKLMDLTAISHGYPMDKKSNKMEGVIECNTYGCRDVNDDFSMSFCNMAVEPPMFNYCLKCLKLLVKDNPRLSYDQCIETFWHQEKHNSLKNMKLHEDTDHINLFRNYKYIDIKRLCDLDELWQKINQEYDSLCMKKINIKRRKSYRQIILPYHQHIYKNYKYTDVKSLDNYLKKEENKLFDNRIMSLYRYYNMKSYSDNFWNCYVLEDTRDGLKWMRRMVYQTASVEKTVSIHRDLVEELQRIQDVDSVCFHNWIYRLRLWISATILDRLVDQINKVNHDLALLGYNKVSVGSVGLNILENISACTVPNLPILLTFLEITPYQQYIVQRISELAKSGSLNDYMWNSGGTYKDKPWHSRLPTDAELIMHLICSYLDQILPLTCYNNTKPFTTKYFIKESQLNSINFNSKIKIIEITRTPPHYNLIINSETQELPAGKECLVRMKCTEEFNYCFPRELYQSEIFINIFEIDCLKTERYDVMNCITIVECN